MVRPNLLLSPAPIDESTKRSGMRKRMDGGWRGVGGCALIVYCQEMEMGRGAVGAPTTPLSPAVGGGGIGIGIGGG
ncbi:uncharacterized protein MONOS_16241 [Monocercomonoides exilis]|uniref:uncharacterized protein n=1 Tax=Monocercomonoides exilis TaxID=2049356 RepID=UPI00355AA076|nr:hypothetical protein MONOS_16241 [Monocercomonoides exilis]|eukprot:MONOS_16241.1-p1 / transcript=MONOS_16241.1 / gene=MONOS_16241 / organism=Monocercomonoides_exilis_PA203 / gene_product=unspecified product / transcript_product=unspecified product / location=Mono_scaffold01583:3036-3667(-) / protein_length=76 / sequence_SO=supercontig / SO=protein_coding / is_pseudo=false